jgi:hypothetical protein
MAIYKFGKLPKKEDERTLQLEKYVTAQAPEPPQAIDWGDPVRSWGTLGNDTIGDCAWAGQAHADMLWYTNAQQQQLAITTQAVLAAYSAATGYDPSAELPNGDNPTDRGTALLDALNYWRTTGIDGHTITAFVEVDLKNTEQVKLAIDLFGCLYVGVQLPPAVEPRSANDIPGWTVSPDGSPDNQPDLNARHSVIYDAHDHTGPDVITWGRRLKASWGFHGAYCDEAYAMLAPDWFDQSGKDPQGLDLNTLHDDLVFVTSQ